jgi:hypothetical protein
MKPFTIDEMKSHVKEWIKEYKEKEKIMKYRKKPVVIEAFNWTGDKEQIEDPIWIIEALKNDLAYFENQGTEQVKLCIRTLEGTMTTNRGDWIIKGVSGEFYPCKPDIFEKTYEKV